jgi:hypothetical protein
VCVFESVREKEIGCGYERSRLSACCSELTPCSDELTRVFAKLEANWDRERRARQQLLDDVRASVPVLCLLVWPCPSLCCVPDAVVPLRSHRALCPLTLLAVCLRLGHAAGERSRHPA